MVVIGAGSAGYAAALRSAQLGLSVTLVEQDRVGGTCLHRGCIPTKALLHAASSADAVQSAAALGVRAEFQGVDAAAIVDYSDQVVGRLSRGLDGLLAGAGIRVRTGRGELLEEPLGVRVGEEVLSARSVVLATGARPVTLGLPVDGQRILTSDHALRLRQMPSSATILGGGVIGVEFASAWASLGVRVRIIEAASRLVPGEEPEVSAFLLAAFRRRGIEVVLDTPVTGAQVHGSGVRVETAASVFDSDLLLVALGRHSDPAASGRRDIAINDDLSTSIAGVYVAGDLVPGPQLAHRGYAHGGYVAELIAHRLGVLPRPPRRPLDSAIPRVTYSSPEIVSVGLTAEQARATGEVETLSYPLSGNGKAQILAGPGPVRGQVHMVCRRGGEIVGIHIVGEHVCELAGEAALIVGWEARPDDLSAIVHAHPSLGEAFAEAALALAGKPLHMHG